MRVETEQWWQIFEMSGRVEDYLRYRHAAESAAGKEAEEHGSDSQRTDRERESRG